MMSPEKAQQFEQFVLLHPDWKVGTRSGSTVMGGVINSILSLSVVDANPGLRAEAVRFLKDKYEINASITHSKSMGGIDVLRVENNGPFHDVTKFTMVRRMANPEAWRSNLVGSERALNLNIHTDVTPEQVEYAQRVLKRWGIESKVADSKSLGTARFPVIKVLRIEGEENIAKLVENIPSLRDFSESASRPGVRDATPQGHNL